MKTTFIQRAILSLVFVFGLGCMSNHEEISERDLVDFSELAEPQSTQSSSVASSEQADLKTKVFGWDPQRFEATGQASGYMHFEDQSCATSEAVDHISAQLDLAVMKMPSLFGSDKFVLKSGVGADSAVRVFVVSDRRTLEALRHEELKSKSPYGSVFLACEDVRQFNAPFIREYAKLYMDQSWSLPMRDALAEYAMMQLNLEARAQKPFFSRWHSQARKLASGMEPKKRESLRKAVGQRGDKDLNLEKMTMTRSFTYFLIEEYGVKKVFRLISATGPDNRYVSLFNKPLTKIRQFWQISVLRDKTLARLSTRRLP